MTNRDNFVKSNKLLDIGSVPGVLQRDISFSDLGESRGVGV